MPADNAELNHRSSVIFGNSLRRPRHPPKVSSINMATSLTHARAYAISRYAALSSCEHPQLHSETTWGSSRVIKRYVGMRRRWELMVEMRGVFSYEKFRRWVFMYMIKWAMPRWLSISPLRHESHRDETEHLGAHRRNNKNNRLVTYSYVTGVPGAISSNFLRSSNRCMLVLRTFAMMVARALDESSKWKLMEIDCR